MRKKKPITGSVQILCDRSQAEFIDSLGKILAGHSRNRTLSIMIDFTRLNMNLLLKNFAEGAFSITDKPAVLPGKISDLERLYN